MEENPGGTAHAETVLYASLTDVDALEQLVKIGLVPDAIPTEDMRQVVDWATEYFHRSGRLKAPSREALTAQWGTVLERCQITLPEEDVELDDITWAIDYLTSQHILVRSQSLQRETAIELAGATIADRRDVVVGASERWFEFADSVRDKSHETKGIPGIEEAMARYEVRASSDKPVTGMSVGIEAVNKYIIGVQPGEIAIWGAPPKGSKSWSMSKAALDEWEAERVTVLFTLENSVPMTMDRLVCQKCCVDYESFQRGTCTEEELDRVHDWLRAHGDRLRENLHVVQPELGRRTPAALVRHSQSLGADSIVLDQFTHVEHPQPGRKARWEQVRDNMQAFGSLITTGRKPLPLLMAHQFKREAVAAIRSGKIPVAEDLAEGAEIERSATWVFGLTRSETEIRIGQASLHLLAGRRMAAQKGWRLAFEPWYGIQEARGELDY